MNCTTNPEKKKTSIPKQNKWDSRLRLPNERTPSKIQVPLDESSSSTDSTYNEDDDSDDTSDEEEVEEKDTEEEDEEEQPTKRQKRT